MASMSLLSSNLRRSEYFSTGPWATLGNVVGWLLDFDESAVGCVVGDLDLWMESPLITSSYLLLRTFSSASHKAVSRTPFSLDQASICDLPRPLKPMTPMRMSSLDPMICPYDLAVNRDNPTAAAAAAEPFKT